MGQATPTVMGSGSSSSTDSQKAALDAYKMAAQGLGGRTPAGALVFAGPDHDLRAITHKVTEQAKGVHVVGCTTAGEFTERGLMHHGVAMTLVASDGITFGTTFVGDLKASPERAASSIVSGLFDTQREAEQRRRIFHNVLTLVDPLTGAGDRAVGELRKALGTQPQIVGGAAGDEGRFKRTLVADGKRAGPDALVALHGYADRLWGVGVDNGLGAATDTMQVTKASGAVVHEINHRPAFDVYKEFARAKGVDLEPTKAGPFLIKHELGIFVMGKLRRARAPLSVGADGSLSCAAEVPEGAQVCILDGEPEKLVQAARNAAKEAFDRLKGQEAAGVIVFDCICRGIILGDQFKREIDAVADVFPKVPITGFLTYGEIARYGGQTDVWHNTTAVVVAIPK